MALLAEEQTKKERGRRRSRRKQPVTQGATGAAWQRGDLRTRREYTVEREDIGPSS